MRRELDFAFVTAGAVQCRHRPVSDEKWLGLQFRARGKSGKKPRIVICERAATRYGQRAKL